MAESTQQNKEEPVLETFTQPTNQSFVKRNKKTLLILLGAIIVIVASIVLLVNLTHKPKPKPKPLTATQGMRDAIKVTNSNSNPSSITNYNEAFTTGQIYEASNNNKLAYEAYARALALSSTPVSPSLYLELGQTSAALHNNAQAKQYYQQALNSPDASKLGVGTIAGIKSTLKTL